MRSVLHVIESPGLGGTQRAMETMLVGLLARGWEAAAVLPTTGLLALRLRATGVPVFDLPVGPVYDTRSGLVVAELVRRRRAGLVHVHTPRAGMLVRRAARRAGARVVLSAHGPGERALLGGFDATARNLKRSGRAALEAWADQATDLFLVESREDLDRGLYPVERTRLLYNAVPLEDFPWSLSPQNGVILFPASLSDRRDPATLVRALKLLVDRGVDARVEFAGDGERRGETEALVRQLGLAGRVVFLSGSRTGAELYRPVSVVALTTRHEGQPCALLEAMAVGRPVVATRCGAVPETLGDAGFAVPAADPAAVADALQSLLVDARFRADVAASARARVEGEFSVMRMLDGLEDAYRAAIGSS